MRILRKTSNNFYFINNFLGQNNITEIPDDLAKLSALKMLNLEHNKITVISESLKQRHQYNNNIDINLSFNPLLIPFTTLDFLYNESKR